MVDAFVIAYIAGGASVLTAIVALGGVFAGALLEPFKLKAAATAQSRRERVESCAALVRSAREMLDNLRDFREAWERSHQSSPRRQELMNTARVALSQLRTASALVELAGPDPLGATARAVREAAVQVVWPDSATTTMPTWTARVDALEAAIDAFIVAARAHRD